MSHLITKEMKAELERERAELESVRRPEIIKKLEYAKSLGDLSENAEYHAAREEQRRLEERLAKITHILKTSKLSEKSGSAIAAFGSTVLLQKKGESGERAYTIVSPEEVDTTKGKISDASPLGLAILGKKKGDACFVDSPRGKIEYLIVEVR